MISYKERLKKAFPVFREMLSKPKPFVMSQGVAGGSAGDHTFSKIKKGDQLVSVMHHSVASISADLTDEFVITNDGVITNTSGTDTSSDFIVATWIAWDAR